MFSLTFYFHPGDWYLGITSLYKNRMLVIKILFFSVCIVFDRMDNGIEMIKKAAIKGSL